MDIKIFLQRFQDKKLFYTPNPGNGGDALIAYSTYRLFKELNLNYQVITSNTNIDGEVVLFGGGGNLVDEYSNCSNFIKANVGKAKEIIILPHTVSGHKDLLSKLDDKVTIICREEISYNYVTSFKNLPNVYLMPDLVIGLTFDASNLKKTRINRLFYLVNKRHMFSSLYKKTRSLNFYLKRRDNSRILNAFRGDKEKTNITIPADNIDVSAVINFDSSMNNEQLVQKTVYNIASFLTQFDVINTNRLHICITAALLGKQVNFYGNSYWKNESVYNYSIKSRFPNVKWMK